MYVATFCILLGIADHKILKSGMTLKTFIHVGTCIKTFSLPGSALLGAGLTTAAGFGLAGVFLPGEEPFDVTKSEIKLSTDQAIGAEYNIPSAPDKYFYNQYCTDQNRNTSVLTVLNQYP